MLEIELIRLCKNKNVYIYGAGMVGGLVFKRLIANGIIKEKIGFVVSSANRGQRYMGCDVTDIHNTKIDESAVILVSTLKKNQYQIIKTLCDIGICNYHLVDEELYEDLEQAYVKDYLSCHELKESKKEILFLSSDNNSSSGAFLCLIDINKELNKRGISTLVVLPVYGNGEELLIENNIDYTYILSKDWLGEIGELPTDLNSNEIAISKIYQLINKLNIRLVHNNTTYTYVGAEAAKRAGIPYIWHIREYIKEQGFWFYNENDAYDVINNAEVIIPVSKYVANCYTGFNVEKVSVVYDGIDVNRYLDYHEIFTSEVVRILMPGSLIPLKGQKQLIEAAAVLKDKGFNFQITFVGSGDADYIAELKDIVNDNNLVDKINFYDRTNELEKWYQKSDIVVVCSRSEAFGRVTVEAQLAGCLVIGAKCGATQELINDFETGIFFELNNPYDLAEKIEWTANHKMEVRKIISKAQENVRFNFSKEKNAEKIITIYRDILSSNSNEIEDIC